MNIRDIKKIIKDIPDDINVYIAIPTSDMLVAYDLLYAELKKLPVLIGKAGDKKGYKFEDGFCLGYQKNDEDYSEPGDHN